MTSVAVLASSIASFFTLILVVLKVSGTVALSWWWVASPLWGMAVGAFCATVVIGFLAVEYERSLDRHRKEMLD